MMENTLTAKEAKGLLAQCLSKILSTAGFRRKGSSWYLHSEETIFVVNLQDTGNWYINFGIFVKGAQFPEGTNPEWPKEHQCHLDFRLYHVIGYEEDEKFLRATIYSRPEYESILVELMDVFNTKILPLLSSLKSLASIFDLLSRPVGDEPYDSFKAADGTQIHIYPQYVTWISHYLYQSSHFKLGVQNG